VFAVNVIIVPALALAVEPAEPRIMRQPPRDPREAILSSPVTRSIVGYAVLISLSTLSVFAWGLARAPDDPAYARTLAFMTLAFGQIFHLGNARSALPVVRPARVISNPYALAAVGVTATLQVLTVELQSLAGVLRTHSLGPSDWLVIAGLALVPALVGQTIKTIVVAQGRFFREERS
jgi:Ca2+-transporting ATPase